MPYEFVRTVDTDTGEVVHTVLRRESGEDREEALQASMGDSYRPIVVINLPSCVQAALHTSDETDQPAITSMEALYHIVNCCRDEIAVIVAFLRKNAIVTWEPIPSYECMRSAGEGLQEAQESLRANVPLSHDDVRQLVASILAEGLHEIDLECCATPNN